MKNLKLIELIQVVEKTDNVILLKLLLKKIKEKEKEVKVKRLGIKP